MLDVCGVKGRRARWGVGDQGVEQRLDRGSDLEGGFVEGRLVDPGGLLVTADLAHKLQSGSLHVFWCGGGVNVVEGEDISAHILILRDVGGFGER